jgi:hypothetical protein
MLLYAGNDQILSDIVIVGALIRGVQSLINYQNKLQEGEHWQES